MPLRTLFKYLANNERLVQRLAESYPVRRAAQLSISFFYKSKEKFDPAKANILISVFRRFTQNLKEDIENAKKQLKK